MSESSKAGPQRSGSSKEPGLPLDVFLQQSRSNSPTDSKNEISMAFPQRKTKSKEPSLPLDVFGLGIGKNASVRVELWIVTYNFFALMAVMLRIPLIWQFCHKIPTW
jgi:hypothetical protein